MGGENYGWRRMEGSHCFNPSSNCNNGILTLPVLEYSHSAGCSISGGYRYHGVFYPGLEGVYFYADYCSGRIWGAQEDDSGAWTSNELLASNLRITAFGEDDDGEVYLAHFASPAGAIYRIATQVPGAPGYLTAVSASPSEIDLNWLDNATNEDGFRIERKTGLQGAYSTIATVNPDILSYSDTGLSEGTSYHYRVVAFNSKGDSAYSGPASATTSSTGSSSGGSGGGGGGCFIGSAANARFWGSK